LASVVIFALANVLAIAFNNVCAGVAARRLPVYVVLVLASPVALGVSLIAMVFFPAPWAVEAVAIGLVAGAVGGLGLLAGYRALAIGPIGSVTAIFASTATVLLVIAGFFGTPPVSWMTFLVVGLCIVAIVLVTRDERPADIRLPALFLGIAGGVGAGFFVLLMSFTSESDGFTPVVAVRVGVFVVAIVAIVVVRRTLLPGEWPEASARWWVAACAAGVMDGLANVFLLVAIRSLDLITVAIIGATSPAVTAFISWVVVREKLRISQRLGLAIAVGAVVLHRVGA
jgi:drug/metabolite transporter (DMT)-like permease